MIFTIYRIDRLTALGGRDTHRVLHHAYLKEFRSNILIAGPLYPPANEEVGGPADSNPREIGSLFIVEFNSLAEAEQFAHNDPFHKENLFECVEVRPFEPKIGSWLK